MTTKPTKKDIFSLSSALLLFTITMLWLTTTIITNLGYIKTHTISEDLVSTYEMYLRLEELQHDPDRCSSTCTNTYQRMQPHYQTDALKSAYQDYRQSTPEFGYTLTPAPYNAVLLQKSARLIYQLKLADRGYQAALTDSKDPQEEADAPLLSEKEFLFQVMEIHQPLKTFNRVTIIVDLAVLLLFLAFTIPWTQSDAVLRRAQTLRALRNAFMLMIACSTVALGIMLTSV